MSVTQGNDLGSPKRRLLVVDDEAKICRVLAEHFSIQGYAVMTARGGEDAMTIAYTFHPVVVLLDLLMPGMTGIDTLKQLKQLNPAPQVLMISAADHEEVVKGALNLGADSYIHKPLNLLDLDLLVNDCCVKAGC